MAKGKHQKFKLYRLAQIKHYRVDKMLKIQMSEEEREVTLLADNSLAGVIIDRFGKDVMLIPQDEKQFTVHVKVHVSRQFLGRVFSLGEQVKITGPEEVVEEMRQEVKCLMSQYHTGE